MTPVAPRKAFDVPTRNRILADHAVVLTALDELGHLATGADPALRHRLLVHSDLYTEYSISVRTEYARGVPVVGCRDAVHERGLPPPLHRHLWARRPVGDYESPGRPTESVTSTFVGLTGALRATAAIEYTPFLVKPGPSAPFVVPRILEAGAVAVLSEVAIGSHTGYAVAYFAQTPLQTTLFNEWGANSYRQYDRGVARCGMRRPRLTQWISI